MKKKTKLKVTTPKQRTASSAFQSKNIETFKAAVKDKVAELKQGKESRLALSVYSLAFEAVRLAKRGTSDQVTTNHLVNAFTSIQKGVTQERESIQDVDNVVKRATSNTEINTQTAADILGEILAQD